MAEKLNCIWIPTPYKKVDLPGDDESKKRELEQYNGELVLINDLHHCEENSYMSARLRIDTDDWQCYYAQRIREDGNINETRLHFNDLEGLIVPDHRVIFRHDFK